MTLFVYKSYHLLPFLLLFSDPQTSPSHVDDPDGDGDDGEEAADDEIDPPQIGDDVGRGSVKVEDAGAEDGLGLFLVFVRFEATSTGGKNGGTKTYCYKGAREED